MTVGNEALMLEMAQKIVSGTLSVRDTEREAGHTRRRRLIPKRKLPALSEIESYLKQTWGFGNRVIGMKPKDPP